MAGKLPGRLRSLGPQSIFRATAIKHISYHTNDYARSRDWFMDLFGMTCTFDDGKQAAVTFGNPPRDIYCRAKRENMKVPVIDHWAIAIINFEAKTVKDTMERWGLNPRYDGPAAWNAQDWDGTGTQVAAEFGCFPGSAVGGEYAMPRPTPEGKIPSGNKASRPGAWRATAFNHISYGVPNYARSRDFYMDLFGMRIAFEDGLQCSLAFGGPPEDAIYFYKKDDGPFFDHMAISVANFDLDKVEADIKRLGLTYKPHGDSAWALFDPDGFRVEVCAETGVYPGAAVDPFHQTRKK